MSTLKVELPTESHNPLGWAPRENGWSRPCDAAPGTELSLVKLLTAHLPADANWACECAVQGRARIDVCVLDEAGLTGIEAKLYDWRRGIGQAYLNRYSVDYSFLALPASQVGPRVAGEANRFGLGLLAVTQSRVSVVNEPELAVPSPTTRALLITRCSGDGS